MTGQTVWKGAFAIPLTPFDAKLNIVWEEIRMQIEFAIAAGAHGVVGPILASEVYTYSDSERRQFYSLAAETVRGRVPYIAGVSGNSGSHAVELAAAAKSAGATGLIAMAPLSGGRTPESTARYFATFLEHADLPTVVQNAPNHFTAPLSTEQLLEIANAHPHVVGIKEEAVRSPQGMGALVARLDRPEVAVFGGFGGLHLMNELSRGVGGTMVACEFIDVVARIFEHHWAGNGPMMNRIFRGLQPMLVLEQLYGMRFAKVCLRKRGIIQHTQCRDPFPELDETDLALIDRLWVDLEPEFRVGEV